MGCCLLSIMKIRAVTWMGAFYFVAFLSITQLWGLKYFISLGNEPVFPCEDPTKKSPYVCYLDSCEGAMNGYWG